MYHTHNKDFKQPLVVIIALKGKGRILSHVRGGYYIYISRDVALDSSFPYTPPEDVKIRIEGKKLIVERV
jgi:hypothetical protein